jgi:hypothetical protein
MMVQRREMLSRSLVGFSSSQFEAYSLMSVNQKVSMDQAGGCGIGQKSRHV